MSVTEVTARIQQIQSQLAMLAPPATGAASATAFAGSLAAARTDTATVNADGTIPPSGDAVVTEARKYLGVPYVWGGTDPKSGLDCSGLVQLVYKNLGVDLPRVSWQQAKAGTEVTGGLANARPGDILAFGSPVHHVGDLRRERNDGRGAPTRQGRPGRARSTRPPRTSGGSSRHDNAFGAGGIAASAARVAPSTPYANLFSAAADRYGVPATLLSAVARQESGYDPKAVSPAGAQGLMQLMPGHGKRPRGEQPVRPRPGGRRSRPDAARPDRPVRQHRAGPRGVQRRPGAVLKYDGIPPYPETQRYVRNVMSPMERRMSITPTTPETAPPPTGRAPRPTPARFLGRRLQPADGCRARQPQHATGTARAAHRRRLAERATGDRHRHASDARTRRADRPGSPSPRPRCPRASPPARPRPRDIRRQAPTAADGRAERRPGQSARSARPARPGRAPRWAAPRAVPPRVRHRPRGRHRGRAGDRGRAGRGGRARGGLPGAGEGTADPAAPNGRTGSAAGTQTGPQTGTQTGPSGSADRHHRAAGAADALANPPLHPEHPAHPEHPQRLVPTRHGGRHPGHARRPGTSAGGAGDPASSRGTPARRPRGPGDGTPWPRRSPPRPGDGAGGGRAPASSRTRGADQGPAATDPALAVPARATRPGSRHRPRVRRQPPPRSPAPDRADHRRPAGSGPRPGLRGGHRAGRQRRRRPPDHAHARPRGARRGPGGDDRARRCGARAPRRRARGRAGARLRLHRARPAARSRPARPSTRIVVRDLPAAAPATRLRGPTGLPFTGSGPAPDQHQHAGTRAGSPATEGTNRHPPGASPPRRSSRPRAPAPRVST